MDMKEKNTSNKCPECDSEWISPLSSLKEFNPEDLLCCCKCMCHFRKDGTVVKNGDRAKFDRLEKERLKPKRKKRKRKSKVARKKK